MTPFHLTLDHLKASARQAYAEKRLVAQNPDTRIGPRCVYRAVINEKVCGCAVGVSLPDETIQMIDHLNSNAASVDALVDTDTITIKDQECSAIQNIQSLHDAWASNLDAIDAESFERQFLKAIEA